MDRVQLPPLLIDMLKGSEHEASVLDAVANCSDFFGDPTRAPVFFPEYTEHGVRHVQRVLDSAVALIHPAAQKHLTRSDAAALTVAVLLHDSAMHITEDGFLSLIRSIAAPAVPEFDADDWSLAWRKYFADATRWDDRQLRRVIGDATEVGYSANGS